MIKTVRKTTVIDITPSWWGSWDARSWARNAKALCAGLESIAMEQGPIHELTSCFVDVLFGLHHVAVTVVVLTEILDEEIELRRRALIDHFAKFDPFMPDFEQARKWLAEEESRRAGVPLPTVGKDDVMCGTAQFHPDGSVTLLNSHGAVSVGTRAPCTAGHAPNIECDLCRGECLGRGELPPDAVELPC